MFFLKNPHVMFQDILIFGDGGGGGGGGGELFDRISQMFCDVSESYKFHSKHSIAIC